MRPPPFAGHHLVRFRECRIGVDGSEDLVEAEAVLHRQHEFRDDIAGMLADNRHAEDPVVARRGQNLDETVSRALGDGAIKIVDGVTVTS